MIDKKILRTNIITALRLQPLSPAKKLALLDKMAQVVEKRVLLRVMKTLNAKDAEEIEKITALDDQAKAEFIQKKIPNLLEIMMAEIAAVKKIMLAAGGVG